MIIRKVVEEDFSMIEQWQLDWNQYPRQRNMYPTTGYIVESDGVPLYCGFIWKSDSAMAMIGFITRNPKAKVKDKQTLKRFIHDLYLRCYEMGFTMVATWAQSPFLKKEFRELGMTETSETCSEFFINLKE